MGGDLEHSVQPVKPLKAGVLRAAAVRVADQVGIEHPHPADDVHPQLAGHAIAKDPAVRADLTELLDKLGLLPTWRKAS